MPLHPQAQSFLDLIAKKNAPPWEDLEPVVSRTMFNDLKAFFGEGPEHCTVSDQTINGNIPVRIYRPSTTSPLPAVMYFHGGGWVLGNIETHDALCRQLAVASNSVVFNVDYRLAPEHPFPTAFDDCFEATRFVSNHAEDLGVDPGKIAVAGDSAGGNLAAVVALKARDFGSPNIHSQWLIYPVIEPNFNSDTYRQFASNYGLTLETMKYFWDQYVPNEKDRMHPYAAPVRAENLKGLPFTQIITAEYDVLREEGEIYGAKLKEAGVNIELIQYDGMLHGFMHFSAAFDDGKQAVLDLGNAMKSRFES